MSRPFITPADFPRGLTLDELIVWIVGRGMSDQAKHHFAGEVFRLNGRRLTDDQLDDLFPQTEDEVAAQSVEDALDDELDRTASENQLRLIGNRWEFVGGVTPSPPPTILKPFGTAPGAPPRAVYPATRTVQESIPGPRGRPPRAVYPE